MNCCKLLHEGPLINPNGVIRFGKWSWTLSMGSEKRSSPLLKMWGQVFYAKMAFLGPIGRGFLLPWLYFPSPSVERKPHCKFWCVIKEFELTRNAPIVCSTSRPNRSTGIWGRTKGEKCPRCPSAALQVSNFVLPLGWETLPIPCRSVVAVSTGHVIGQWLGQ